MENNKKGRRKIIKKERKKKLIKKRRKRRIIKKAVEKKGEEEGEKDDENGKEKEKWKWGRTEDDKEGKKEEDYKELEKSCTNIQYQIWTNDGSRTVYDSSPYSFLFFGVYKKDKGGLRIYIIIYINSESDKVQIR